MLGVVLLFRCLHKHVIVGLCNKPEYVSRFQTPVIVVHSFQNFSSAFDIIHHYPYAPFWSVNATVLFCTLYLGSTTFSFILVRAKMTLDLQ